MFYIQFDDAGQIVTEVDGVGAAPASDRQLVFDNFVDTVGKMVDITQDWSSLANPLDALIPAPPISEDEQPL